MSRGGRRMTCATGLTDEQLEQAAADGALHPGDLDEVRRFGDFLRATHGVDDPDEKARIYLEHYPEQATP